MTVVGKEFVAVLSTNERGPVERRPATTRRGGHQSNPSRALPCQFNLPRRLLPSKRPSVLPGGRGSLGAISGNLVSPGASVEQSGSVKSSQESLRRAVQKKIGSPRLLA